MLGFELFAGLHTKAQAVHNAGPVVFQQNVCRFDKLGKKSLSFGGLEVQRNGLLSAVDVGKVGGKCAHARLPHTRRVALGALHFNNFGPHVGQVRAAQRPCDGLGKVNYTDSVQNTLFHAITPLFLGAPAEGACFPVFPHFRLIFSALSPFEKYYITQLFPWSTPRLTQNHFRQYTGTSGFAHPLCPCNILKGAFSCRQRSTTKHLFPITITANSPEARPPPI